MVHLSFWWIFRESAVRFVENPMHAGRAVAPAAPAAHRRLSRWCRGAPYLAA
jgi:hypothetical protein